MKLVKKNQIQKIRISQRIKTATTYILERPITPIEEFERALDKAALTKEEYELIDIKLL